MSENPFRWNKIANMLFIEAPCGVGFSYVENPADLKTGDLKTARDNYQLIRQFFARFPALLSNPFFISSESYGGCVGVCGLVGRVAGAHVLSVRARVGFDTRRRVRMSILTYISTFHHHHRTQNIQPLHAYVSGELRERKGSLCFGVGRA